MKQSVAACSGMMETDRLESEILKYVDMLGAVASRFTDNPSVVRQLVTETVTAAWRAPELRQQGVHVKPWLLTKMRHLYTGRCAHKRPTAAPGGHNLRPAFHIRTPFDDDTARLSSFLNLNATSDNLV